jgi:DNA-binding protein Fis
VALSEPRMQRFINAPSVPELLKAFKGDSGELRLESSIRLEVALEALKDGLSLTEIIQNAVWQLEKYVIMQILKSTSGNKAETARILKIDYKTLYRKMHKYFETFPDFVATNDSDERRVPLDVVANREPAEPIRHLKSSTH